MSLRLLCGTYDLLQIEFIETSQVYIKHVRVEFQIEKKIFIPIINSKLIFYMETVRNCEPITIEHGKPIMITIND